jgi:hypothetical protein
VGSLLLHRTLPGDSQLEELSAEEKVRLLEKPLCQRRMPSKEFIRDRLSRRARRLAMGHRITSYAEFWDEYLPIAGAASYVTVTLDTTGPADPSVSINSGDIYATDQTVTLTIGTSDGDTTGYQMKVYGDVDEAADPNVQSAEGDSAWITYSTSKSIELSSGDGSKTVYVKIRDDVWNVSSEASDSITLDTTQPTVTVQSGPTPARISKVSGKDETEIVWQSDQQYDAYKVKVVATSGAAHSTGTQIPTTAGSSNVSGSTANQPEDTNVTTTVNGTDLETASAGDGAKIIKVFVQNDAGTWSS